MKQAIYRYTATLILIPLAALVACGGAQSKAVFSNVSNGLSSGGSPATRGSGPAPAGQGSAQDATTGNSDSQSNSVGNVSIGPLPPGKQLERSVTVSYTVEHGHFERDLQQIINIASSLPGDTKAYVESSNTQPDDSGRIVSGSVTIKIPASELSNFIAAIPTGPGKEFQTSAINYSTTDHTSQYVDVQAQIKAAQGHLDALNQLLAKATSLGDITSLENQIVSIQQQLDTYEGQRNEINQQVDFATATVSINERGVHVVTTPPPSPLITSLQTGWNNVIAIAAVVLLGVVTVSPFIVLAVLALAGWWVRRTWVRRKVPTAPDATAS